MKKAKTVLVTVIEGTIKPIKIEFKQMITPKTKVRYFTLDGWKEIKR